MSDTTKVLCLYCLVEVEMPSVTGVEYVKWPVVHSKCSKEKGVTIPRP